MSVTVPNFGALLTGACYITVITDSAVGFTMGPAVTTVGSGTKAGVGGSATVFVETGGTATGNGGGDTFYVKSGGTASSAGGGSNTIYAETGASASGGTIVSTPEVDASPVAALFAIVDPPAVVSTGSAAGISFTGATLNGTVNPEGSSATTYFQYGATTAYGTQTASQSILGHSQVATSITQVVTGLVPGTVYHCQLVAITNSGISYGGDSTFTTASTSASGAPGIVNEPPNAVTYDSATLNTEVNPGGAATTVQCQYGLTGTYGSATTPQMIGGGAADVAVQGLISGLLPNTIYHYCVVASNANGVTTGADETFLTGAVGIARYSPAAATAGTPVTLSGVGFTGATNVTFYDAAVGLSAAASFTVISDTEMTVTPPSFGTRLGGCYISVVSAAGATVTLDPSATIVESGSSENSNGGALMYIEPGGNATNNGSGSCTYFLKNGGALGGSGGGGDNVAYAEPGAVVTLPGVSTTAVPVVSQSPVTTLFQLQAPGPIVVTGTAFNAGSTGASVNGMITPGIGGRASYDFRYGTTTSYGSQSASQSIGAGSQGTSPAAANLTNLAPGTLYHFQLVGTNSGGTNYGADETFTTSSLPVNGAPAVTNEPASGVTCNATTLNAMVNPNSAAATVDFEYGVSNGYGSVSPAQVVVSGSTDVAVSGILSGLSPNTTYHYCVVASNAGGATTSADQTFHTGAVGVFSVLPAQAGPGGTVLVQGVGFTTATSLIFQPEIGSAVTASFTVLSDTEMAVTIPSCGVRTQGAYLTVVTAQGTTVTQDPTLTVVGNGEVAGSGGSATLYVESGGDAYNNGSGGDTYYLKNGSVLNGSGGGGDNTAYAEPGATVSLPGVTTVVVPNLSQSPMAEAFEYISPGTARTGSCSGISINSAITTGTVNPEGSPTVAYIQYGQASSGSTMSNALVRALDSAEPVYTGQTASQSIGSGTSDTALAVSVTGLAENTLYHYRVVVSNSAGATYGADSEFSTNPGPYTFWQQAEFNASQLGNTRISGATANPTGDGICNLMKYAEGLNPMVGTAVGQPVLGTATINGTACYTFTYTKVDAATDITYQPEWSSDLVNWSNTGLTEAVLSDNGTIETVQDSIPQAAVTGGILFHLRVTMP